MLLAYDVLIHLSTKVVSLLEGGVHLLLQRWEEYASVADLLARFSVELPIALIDLNGQRKRIADASTIVPESSLRRYGLLKSLLSLRVHVAFLYLLPLIHYLAVAGCLRDQRC